MCYGCLRVHYGVTDDAQLKQIAAREPVVAAAALVSALYRVPDCSTGGPIHVVVDDMNVADRHLHIADSEREYYADNPQALQAAEAVLEALRPLSLEERAVATLIGNDA